MGNTDPEDEVGDVHRPHDRMREPPHPEAMLHRVPPGKDPPGHDNQIDTEQRIIPPSRRLHCSKNVAIDLMISQLSHLTLHRTRLDLFEIGDRGLRIQMLQNVIPARVFGQLRYLTLWIMEVTENDGARRTGLGARGNNFSIPQIAILFFGCQLRPPDALDAKGTLLHDPHFSNRNIRIELQVQRLRPLGRMPVKATDLVRAVV